MLLIDGDRIEPGNLMRHTVDITSLGESKALAVRDRLLRIRPDGLFSVPIFSRNGRCVVEKHADQLSASLERYTLVDCTANDTVHDFLSRESRRLSVPYVQTQTYQAGRVGEFVIADPTGPCAACIKDKAVIDYPEISLSDLPEQETTIAEGCASVTQPASAADLAVVCGLSAEGIITLLTDSSVTWNLRYWVARPIPEAPEGSIYAHGPHVWETRVETQGPCPICRP